MRKSECDGRLQRSEEAAGWSARALVVGRGNAERELLCSVHRARFRVIKHIWSKMLRCLVRFFSMF